MGPALSRFFIYLAVHLLEHTIAVTLFRAAAAIGRTAVPANIVSFMSLGLALFFTGFVIQHRAPPTVGPAQRFGQCVLCRGKLSSGCYAARLLFAKMMLTLLPGTFKHMMWQKPDPDMIFACAADAIHGWYIW